jgi:hypothetical protein
MGKGIRVVLFYAAVAVVVFGGFQACRNYHEISEAVRQFRDRKPAFTGSAFDGWIRGKGRE